jgi:outer membrane protein assembly factor BamA
MRRTLPKWSHLTVLVVLFCGLPSPAEEETRAATIEKAREEKARKLAPEELSKGERVLKEFRDKKVLERFSAGHAGFRVKLGGLVSGGGFALGPEYLRKDLARSNLMFRAAAQTSFRNYQRYDMQFTRPGVATDRFFFDLFAVHHNYPGIAYYGPGPDSRKANRTNYRLEDTATDLSLGVHPIRHLSLGASGGYLWVNVGPGTDQRYASSETLFPPAGSPGIDAQTNFARYGFFTHYDYLDNPSGPRSGGYYEFQYHRYIDQNLGRFSFNRVDAEARQFIPLFNKRRVIALRAKTTLTDPTGPSQVPFYLRPTVGGSNDLRGFRQFRFSDNNMMVANAEWRWEVFSGLDMAGFYDAGKVFPRRSQLNFHDLRQSAGLGFRFNARGRVFLRIDVGFSNEGTQVWFKFDNFLIDQRVRSTRFE